MFDNSLNCAHKDDLRDECYQEQLSLHITMHRRVTYCIM